jgi:hypothetical protein
MLWFSDPDPIPQESKDYSALFSGARIYRPIVHFAKTRKLFFNCAFG